MPSPELPRFLDLDERLSDPTTARVALLPCPYDGTSTGAKGADRGPAALLARSEQLEDHDLALGRRPCDVGIATMPALELAGLEPERAVARVAAAAEGLAGGGKFVLGLGGEHSVSVGLTRGLRAARGSFSVLQIDAHADLRDEYHGSEYNHACVMRRISVDDPDAALVAVGIRQACEEEIAFAAQRGVRTFPAHQLDPAGTWIDEVVEALVSPVYLSFDLDGLDPSILPCTGTPIPGGLGWSDTLRLLRRLGDTHEVIGADVVELLPDESHHHGEVLAAQLVYKMIGEFVR